MGVGVDLKLGCRRRDLGFVVEMAGGWSVMELEN